MKVHTIYFYLDPALITPSTPSDLEQYVADMNAILFKTTDRYLFFDPQAGVIPTSTPPHDDSHVGPLPSEGFDVWVHAVFSGIPNYTTQGYSGMNSSGGELVLAGMRWGGIHSAYCDDYAKQIYTMLHEFAHGFNAGISELYSLLSQADNSNHLPLQGIDLLNPSDPFALTHMDWRHDPLLWNVGGATREEFIANCTYSELTSRAINSTWRSYPSTFDTFTVQVAGGSSSAATTKPTRASAPIRDIPYQVYVYARSGALLQQGETDENGRFVAYNFGWSSHVSLYNARLVKVFQGTRFIGQKWVCVFDLDLAKLRGQTECIIPIP